MPRKPQSPASWKLPLDSPEYVRAHKKVREERGPAWWHLCYGCCGSHGQQWAAVPTGFVPLCIQCHIRYDRHGSGHGIRCENFRPPKPEVQNQGRTTSYHAKAPELY